MIDHEEGRDLLNIIARKESDRCGMHPRPDLIQRNLLPHGRDLSLKIAQQNQTASSSDTKFVRPVVAQTEPVAIEWAVVRDDGSTDYLPAFPFDVPFGTGGSGSNLFLKFKPSPAPPMKWLMMVDVGEVAVTNSGAVNRINAQPAVYGVTIDFDLESLTWGTRPGTPFVFPAYTIQSGYVRTLDAGGGYESPTTNATRFNAYASSAGVVETAIPLGGGLIMIGQPLAYQNNISSYGFCITWTPLSRSFDQLGTLFDTISGTMQIRSISLECEAQPAS